MKTWLRKNKGFLVFLLCFGVFRTAIADWNPVPTGSMRPTIVEGDVVLVNRLAYDLKIPLTNTSLVTLGEPRRGDIVTFSSPRDGMRLIKRVVALPGDTVEMKAGVLFVNGVAAEYSSQIVLPEPADFGGSVPSLHATEVLMGSARSVQFLPGIYARRDFARVIVPAQSYFMMGDNRDNSEDSRYIGAVPRRLLVGKAYRLLVSADIKGHWAPRFERIGKSLE